MTTYTELKRLAQAATPIYTDMFGDRHFGGDYSCANLTKEQDDYITHIKPDTVLALIADLEQARAEIAKMREQEPVAKQFQSRDGKWNEFLNEQHERDTIASGDWPIRSVYAAPVAQKGWKLVPVEPTEAMLEAGYNPGRPDNVWSAMLAAAPEAV